MIMYFTFKTYPGGGAFVLFFHPHPREFATQNKKSANARGLARGGGWAQLELTDALTVKMFGFGGDNWDCTQFVLVNSLSDLVNPDCLDFRASWNKNRKKRSILVCVGWRDCLRARQSFV